MSMIVQNACDLLKRGEAFILATIISHSGSTPRTAGSRMIVTTDGHGIGTIGGGLLEAEAMSRALQLMRSGQSAILPVDLNHDTIDTMDMICGGVAEVLLEFVAPTPINRSHFERWRQMLEDREKACLLTFFVGSGDLVETIARGLMTDAGEIAGELSLTDTQRETVLAAAVESSAVQVLPLNGGLVVLEPTQWVCSAYLFGAGHVAQATGTVAAMVGFRVLVSDDREAYANRERFPDSHEVRVIADFAHAFSGLSVGRDDYIVILTRGHLHDKTVLAQALKTDAGYIGMIGSRTKRNTIYGALLKEGFSQADIDRVNSPIGLSIGAETPEEIAVSIVAEMIRHRANS